jgi:hypothetical protein
LTGKGIGLCLILGFVVGLITECYFTALRDFMPYANGAIVKATVGIYVLATVTGPVLILLSMIRYSTLPVQVDGKAALRTMITSIGYTACTVVFIFFSLRTADI